MRTWVIGGGADCDIVVDSPVVSARHCRLTQADDGLFVEDLNSTNGIYVNGFPITSKRRVSPGEAITLGKSVRMPWPPDVVRIIRIGRGPDNDIVLDDPRVSFHHARLMTIAGVGTLIEDAGSSNGTFLNSMNRKVLEPIAVTEVDTIYLGTLAVPARPLFTEWITVKPSIPVPTKVLHEPPPAPKPAANESIIGLENRTIWIVALLAQAPLLALLIVLAFGQHAATAITMRNWPRVADGVASTAFAMALAAIWMGCSNALADLVVESRPTRGRKTANRGSSPYLSSKLAFLCALGVVQCAAMLMIVHRGGDLRGPWLAMFGLLVLAMSAGVLLGWMVTSLIRTRATAAAVLLASLLFMIILGGSVVPPPRMSPALRKAASAIPSRWAFEGLVVLEADHRPTWRPASQDPLAVPIDMAEAYFPAETDRMGPTAAALALVATSIGLAGLIGSVLPVTARH